MEIKEKYNHLTKSINNYLCTKGFQKKAKKIFLMKYNNLCIIVLQKSRSSRKEKIFFTIGIGIYINELHSFYNNNADLKIPSYDNCHWKCHIGNLMEQKKDIWWDLTKNTDVHKLLETILKVISQHAISTINKLIETNEIKKVWIAGISPGLTNFERLIYLTALLKQLNEKELLYKTIIDLRKIAENSPSWDVAQNHIRKLGV